LRELGNQGLAGRRRQVIALQHRLPHGPEMTMTRHDAVERQRCDRGTWIFDQREAGLGTADFGNGSGDRTR
jgi:predicted metal-dependent hydrolase